MSNDIVKEVILAERFLVGPDCEQAETIRNIFTDKLKKELDGVKDGDKFLLAMVVNKAHVDLHAYFAYLSVFNLFCDWKPEGPEYSRFGESVVFVPFIFTYKQSHFEDKNSLVNSYCMTEINRVFASEELLLERDDVEGYQYVMEHWNTPEDFQKSERFVDIMKSIGTGSSWSLHIRTSLHELLRPESLAWFVATVLHHHVPELKTDRLHVRIILEDTEFVYNKKAYLVDKDKKIILSGSFSFPADDPVSAAKRIHKSLMKSLYNGYFNTHKCELETTL